MFDLLSAATMLCAITGLMATGVLLAWGASHYSRFVSDRPLGCRRHRSPMRVLRPGGSATCGSNTCPLSFFFICAILFGDRRSEPNERVHMRICADLASDAIGPLRLLGRTSSQDFVARITRSARFGLPVVAAMIAGVWILGPDVWFQLFGNEDGLFAL